MEPAAAPATRRRATSSRDANGPPDQDEARPRARTRARARAAKRPGARSSARRRSTAPHGYRRRRSSEEPPGVEPVERVRRVVVDDPSDAVVAVVVRAEQAPIAPRSDERRRPGRERL